MQINFDNIIYTNLKKIKNIPGVISNVYLIYNIGIKYLMAVIYIKYLSSSKNEREKKL